MKKSCNLFVELKNPVLTTVKLSFKQTDAKRLLESLGHRFVLSNNSQEIRKEIDEYMLDTDFLYWSCTCSKKSFRESQFLYTVQAKDETAENSC